MTTICTVSTRQTLFFRRLPFFQNIIYLANLQSTCAYQKLDYQTHMYSLKSYHRLLILLMLSPLCAPASANDIDQLDWTGIKEHWGQAMLCQRIYSLSVVKPRLYDFDIEQCSQAMILITGVAGRYSEKDRVELRKQAERHAALLSRNATSPYNAVPACRLFCRDIATSKGLTSD